MYEKVFRSLWTGTLYGRSDPQHVFIYLLCHCAKGGFVDIAPPVIAGATGLPLDRVKEALLDLEGPDPDSRSQELEGRRLERVDPSRPWGWRIVNYPTYQKLRSTEDRRRQNLESQGRHRKQLSAFVSNGKQPSDMSAHSDVDLDLDSDSDSKRVKRLVTATRPRFIPPTLGEVTAYSRERSAEGKPGAEPEAFIDFYASKGWKVGKVGMVDWKCAYRGSARWDSTNGNGHGRPEPPSLMTVPELIHAGLLKPLASRR